ncbi:beta-ketoacyl-[acyl-carrier-protein] synthase family protein [Arthrobacter sp. H5]|uniref:beta-ketoacyl-[acyl-carrier-protein] synthase family protein n=1 Tax=Arthrobacter sp. H5 TaxID=1267973 RepID=UPI0004850328|nr:beta-ketoacyl-[acyl-carrier-protein] synthase family protein [Arthrobacter sp. H5]
MKPSIAVTGMGVVTPAGCTLEDLWNGLLDGKSTARYLDGFNETRFGCQIRGLDPVGTGKDVRRMDAFARYGVTAGLDAYRHAGAPQADHGRAAILVGSAVGGRQTSDQESFNYAERGAAGVNPLMPLMTMPNAAAAALSMKLGWTGPAFTYANTCASSADAIGQGMLMLRSGQVDVVLAGGCEATLSPVTLAAFTNLNALSTRIDDPERASRPFDVGRDGFTMGEGAAFVIMERKEDAVARRAQIHGEVLGYAATADAHHLAMPHPDGLGAGTAMRNALVDAGVEPADISHINAHGTSTPINDRVEAAAIQRLFGSSAPPVTSSKGVLGHLMGAAGAVELISTLLGLRNNTVPPTANHEQLESGMEIDVVHRSPRTIINGPALSNSFGFGGHNASLVVTA